MTPRTILTITYFALLAGVASIANAQHSTPPAPQLTFDDQMVERELAALNAPIKSNQDLNDYLAAQQVTPLDKFSATARQDFLDSLVFGEKGLASFRYDLLEKELTPTDIYSLLSLFGLQGGTAQLDGAQAKTSLDRAILQMNDQQYANSFDGFGGGFPGTSDDFLEGYKCDSPGSCVLADGYACTSNC